MAEAEGRHEPGDVLAILRALSGRIRGVDFPSLSGTSKARFLTAVVAFANASQLQHADVLALEQLVNDARQADVLLDGALVDPIAAGLLATQLDRVVDEVSIILSEKPVAEVAHEGSATPPAQDGQRKILKEVARAYHTDSDHERRLSLFFVLLGFFSVACSGGVAYWMASLAAAAPVGHLWATLIAPLIACSAFVVFGVLCFGRSINHRRTSREYIRLERGLVAVPAYLDTLPPDLGSLMRAIMAQTLFPQLLESSDPVREATWPEADVLLEAITGGPDTGEETEND